MSERSTPLFSLTASSPCPLWLIGRASLLGLSFLVLACATAPSESGTVQRAALTPKHLIQSDMNRVASIAMRNNLESLELLMTKLYKRNPQEWRKTADTMQEAQSLVLSAIQKKTLWPALQDKRDIQALSFALSPEFEGDRVAAFIIACADMIVTAHNGKMDFTLLSRLDGQAIFNAARNMEVAAWVLASRKAPSQPASPDTPPTTDLAPLLLSDEINTEVRNTSFSKELGAITARLDLVAQMMAEKYQRMGVGVFQSLIAGPVIQFLPVR